jgi:hypothetical protein
VSRFAKLIAAAALATAGTNAAQAAHFYAAADGDIIAYFNGSSAGYDEDLGLLINGVDTGIYGLENHSSSYGQSLNFGAAHAGDELTFFIRVFNTGDTWYSDQSLNSDGYDHILHSNWTDDGTIPAGTLIRFEDLPNNGDANFEDEKFVFTNVRAVEGPVPEPASWALMLAGFGLAGAAMRRQRASVRFA